MLHAFTSCNNLFEDTNVSTAISSPFASVDALMPQERIFVEAAVEKRQREFATARVLARRLLADYGIRQYPLLNDDDRVPVWPEGFVGSISHCDDCCAVALLGKSENTISIGIDVEPDTAINPDLWSSFATDNELCWIKSGANTSPGRLAHLLFSAKEAAYKCIFPITRKLIGFHDIEIEFDLEGSFFYPAILDKDLTSFLNSSRLSGRFRLTDGFILTCSSMS
jgi:4'-phosphopantetheinyl transferase EntD